MPIAITISPFRTVFCFVAVVLAAWIILPNLRVSLLPDEKSTTLNISFTLPQSSPDIVEQQVTSIIEGACSQLSQLKKIISISNYDKGNIELQFDKSADIQFRQFELAAIIRQVYPQLPQACSYPLIVNGTSSTAIQNPLLIYSINAPLQPFRIKMEAEDIFRKAFAGMSGIKEAKVSGVENLQLTIRFDNAKCEAWHIEPSRIISSVQSYFAPVYPGNITTNNGEQFFLQLPSPKASIEVIENMPIPVAGTQLIRLKDIAAVYTEEQEPNGYFRINGKNSVNLSLYAREGENKVLLGKRAKEVIAKIQSQLTNGFEIRLDYDDTEFLKKEIAKNYLRAGLSVGILILFILLAYRSWRHLLNLLAGLAVSMCLTIFLAWLFKINIHLYTIAGLAISFGIMMDNTIVMLDYYRQWRNRKVFPALLGSSLTTIAALCLVFFLPEEEKKNLMDFSIIIVLALVSSLITSLWFTPGLHLLLHPSPGKKNAMTAKFIKLRTNIKWQRRILLSYSSIISFIANYRKTFIVLIILGFGLPVFMLPPKWEGDHWYHRWYNASIGSKNYQENIKPKTDKWLGGALYLFVNNVYEKSGYRSPEKTRLYVNAKLPYGNTVDQLNYILSDFENYLATVEGIDKYVTSIYSGQSGAIEIDFKEGYDHSALPYQLKSRLISRSLDWGGMEWNVYGVGQGFSNAGGDEIPGFRVNMKGYNYDELEKQANRLAEKLLEHERIENVNIDERISYDEKQGREYILNLDAGQMALNNTNRTEVLAKINDLSKPTHPGTQVAINNQYYPVVLKEKDAGNYSDYELLHRSIQLDSNRAIRIGGLGKLEFRNTANSIRKEDRQYIRMVGFEYMGAKEFGSRYLKEVLGKMKKEMPAGYTAEEQDWKGDWGKSSRKYVLIFILILSVFFICSILFENLKEPFFIISMIPISFIGLFLTFSLGEYYFDQGGYAAFVMLGGLVSNAAIFIVNDFNKLRKIRSFASYNKLLVKAAANRARTILLTTISTCCGLIPFLVEGQNEVFWFSLAVGTIGGLLFSLVVIFLVLPVLLWEKKKLTV